MTDTGGKPEPDATPAAERAVILCGGLGTRLRAAVPDRPKVLAEVAGTPVLGHQLERLSRIGIRHVVLSAGHLANQIEAFAGDGSRWGLDVEVLVEPELLGTGGALALAVRSVDLREPFVAMNGDTLTSVNIAALVADHHRQQEAVATIAATMSEDRTRYGSIEFDRDRRVTAFREKDLESEVADSSGWINAGVYVLDPLVLRDVPGSRPVSLERELFVQWMPRVFVHPDPNASMLDVGTPEDYRSAEGWLRLHGPS